MRKVLVVLAIVVLSLPLLFVLWLVVAVHSPTLDRVTIQMPDDVRSTVADAAMQNVKFGKTELNGVRRVLALDPKNASAWDRLCNIDSNDETDSDALKDCRTAISLDDSALNWESLGQAQEKANDECAAADSYTKASNLGSTGTDYEYVEHLGRASLRCGKLYDARAGLSAAIDLEDKSLKAPDNDDDEIADDKADQLADREYLIVTLDRLHDSAAERQVCSLSHPDWKSCACKLDVKGNVACVAGQ